MPLADSSYLLLRVITAEEFEREKAKVLAAYRAVPLGAVRASGPDDPR